MIPVLGRSTGEGKRYPFQFSGLENSMDYGLWGLTESDTTERLSTGLPGGQKLEKKTTVPKINLKKSLEEKQVQTGSWNGNRVETFMTHSHKWPQEGLTQQLEDQTYPGDTRQHPSLARVLTQQGCVQRTWRQGWRQHRGSTARTFAHQG